MLCNNFNNDSIIKTFTQEDSQKCLIIINNYFINPNDANNNVKSITKEKDEKNNLRNNEFSNSVQRFVEFLEFGDGEQSISAASRQINTSKRRLYDFTNVLESIGCCRKCRHDWIIWIGKNNIKQKFDDLIKEKNIYNFDLSLTQLFPSNECVGIFNLTYLFILLYFALKTDRIDLRIAAHFFSRKASRFNTTLSKIYQIINILSAIGIMSKTSKISEVMLNTYFFNIEIIKDSNIGSIESFLNSDENTETEKINERKKEFVSYFH